MLPSLLLLAVPASAHLKINGHANYGQRKYAAAGNNPLAWLDFEDWWFHGALDDPPPEGVMYELPAGGVFEAVTSCSTGVPARNPGAGCCDTAAGTDLGTTHTVDRMKTPMDKIVDVRGCGIAIAYESDVTKIKPEDFAVISTNYSCPWVQATDFAIPAGLPACPEGGCHCMWGWIHSPEGGSFGEMYFIGSRCNVTGQTGTVPIPKPQIARKCPFDKNNCTTGAKQPHYWFQNERNNNFQGVDDAPFYNGDYGFANGAQTDLWEVPNESLYAHECDWAPQHLGYKGGWGTSRNARPDYAGVPLEAKPRKNITNPVSQCVNWTKEAVPTSAVTSTIVNSSATAASSSSAAAAAAAAAASSSAAAASSSAAAASSSSAAAAASSSAAAAASSSSAAAASSSAAAASSSAAVAASSSSAAAAASSSAAVAASSSSAAAASSSSSAAAAASSSAAAASSTSTTAAPAVTTFKYAPADDSDIKAWVLSMWAKEAAAKSSAAADAAASSASAASASSAAAASSASAAAASSDAAAAPGPTIFKYAPADDSDIKAWVLNQMKLDAARDKRDDGEGEAGVAEHKAGRRGGHKRRGQF